LQSYFALVTQISGSAPIFYVLDGDLFFGFPINDGDRESDGDVDVFASGFNDCTPGGSAHYGCGVLADIEGNGEEHRVARFAVVIITTVNAEIAEAVEFAVTVEGKDTVVRQSDGDWVNDAYATGAEGLIGAAQLTPAVDFEGCITTNYADGVIDAEAPWAIIVVDVAAVIVKTAEGTEVLDGYLVSVGQLDIEGIDKVSLCTRCTNAAVGFSQVFGISGSDDGTVAQDNLNGKDKAEAGTAAHFDRVTGSGIGGQSLEKHFGHFLFDNNLRSDFLLGNLVITSSKGKHQSECHK
jgi:hypothetical protein